MWTDRFVSWKERVLNMSKEEFEAFLKEKTEEISNKAADKVLDELVDKVMEEGDEGQ
jgi:nucleoid DNA-binding protein